MIQPLGQRLREWREVHGLTIADAAQRLEWNPATLEGIEDGVCQLMPSRLANLESLLKSNPNHEQIIDSAMAAIRAGLEQGCTVVQIVRPATLGRGRVVVTLGESDDAPDPEWRIEP